MKEQNKTNDSRLKDIDWLRKDMFHCFNAMNAQQGKTILCIILILNSLSCRKIDIVRYNQKLNFQPPCTIGNMNSYLKNPKVNKLAKDYYRIKFHPTDDSITMSLLYLTLTDDNLVRPFYVWCLNNVALHADGALVEYIGLAYRKYIETYPKEFLFYNRSKCINRNAIWPTLINSVRYDEEEQCCDKMAFNNFKKETYKNCNSCDSNELYELSLFAFYCYPPDNNNRPCSLNCPKIDSVY